MKKYEITIVLSEKNTEDKAKEISEDIVKLIEKSGGKIEKNFFWGKRKLAYQIEGNTFGYYFVLVFDAGTDVTEKLNRDLNLDDRVMRYFISNFVEGSPFFDESGGKKTKKDGRDFRDKGEKTKSRGSVEEEPKEEKTETKEDAQDEKIEEESAKEMSQEKTSEEDETKEEPKEEVKKADLDEKLAELLSDEEE